MTAYRLVALGTPGVDAVRTTDAGTGSAATTYYTRDPQGHVLGQHGAAGTGYYYSDRLFDTIALLTTAGVAATTYAYTPYGATSITSTGTLDTPFRFTGGYQDIEGDGYYHLGARYYDPTTGAFTQPDSVQGSVANPRTLNIYSYTGGNPVNTVDPTGHDFLDGVGEAFGAIGGALGFAELGEAAGVAFETAAAATGVLATTVGIIAGGLTVLAVGSLVFGGVLAYDLASD